MTKKEIIKRLKKLVEDYQSSGSSAGHWLFEGVQELIKENSRSHIDYFEAGNAVMDSMDEKKT